MTLFGWDASDFDHDRGSMNLVSAAADGIKFFTHKYTEGTKTKHQPRASINAAKTAGIPFIGAYMVPRTPGNSGHGSVSAQVDYFLAYVDSQTPWWDEFPGWFFQMDTEKWSYDFVSASVGHQAAQLIKQRTGKAVLHYAPKWAYNDSVPSGEPLWASAYVAGSGPYRVLYPGDNSSRWGAYSGRAPAILQYSSKARIGSQSTCDANAFRGTENDFRKLIGGALIVVPTSTRKMMDMDLVRVGINGQPAVYITGMKGTKSGPISPALNDVLKEAGFPLIWAPTEADMNMIVNLNKDAGSPASGTLKIPSSLVGTATLEFPTATP